MAFDILQPQFCDFCLTFRAVFPNLFGALVATDVDVFRGENVHNFLQHIFGELHCGIVATTQYIVEHAVAGSHLIRAAGAAKLGIGSQCGKHVAGQVNFRNHSDVAFGSIGDYLSSFVLGVESAHRNAVEIVPAGFGD